MRKPVLIFFFLSANLILSAQMLMTDTERDKRLGAYGKVVTKNPAVRLPVGKGIGLVGTYNIKESETETLRLHFKVSKLPVGLTWALRVLDSNNQEVWTYSPTEIGEKEFWSNEVVGNTARIEIYSTIKNNSLELEIDSIAITMTPVIPQAITSPNNLESIEDQPENIKKLGIAVVRLRFVSDYGKQNPCTGFLISDDLVMTNLHCLQSEKEWRNAMVEFDANSSSVKPVVHRFKELILPKGVFDRVGMELDVAILRLQEKQPQRKKLKLDPEIALTEKRSLLVIQHPGGEAKQISLIDCKIKGASVAGITRRLTDFGHLCDTVGGSSGAAMIDLSSEKVIGLHHLSFTNASTNEVNRAVSIRLIIDYIKKERLDIWEEIEKAT